MRVLNALQVIFKADEMDPEISEEVKKLEKQSAVAVNAYEKRLQFSNKTGGFGSSLQVEKTKLQNKQKGKITKEKDIKDIEER